MKRRTILLTLCIFFACFTSQTSQACTTFSLDHNNQPIVGKNYDWHLERGLVIINKRGVSKTALEDRKKDPGPFARWISRYGSLTFNQYGRELPMGGINEAGLVVELMSLGATKYPAPDSRPALGCLQWIQYQLDSFSKVEQVIASDSHIRIHPDEGSGIHFLIADKEGNCAVIEFLNGERVYYTHETLPIKALANSTYAKSMAYLKRHKGFGGNQDMLFGSQSLDRFARAAKMLKMCDTKTQTIPIHYAFGILADVANPTISWGTKWSIVYDIQHLKVYFRTFTNKQIRFIDLHAFDLSCQAPVKVLDMNLDASGDMTDDFRDYTPQLNLDLIRHSFKETSFLRNVPDSFIEELAKYPEHAPCKK
ncbi:MAG: linear amide C-N hydrolase [Deltaproteobacteria bacterium]|nr:linear amide C-N hydrolase [Deltaproteobacteria bacterium]